MTIPHHWRLWLSLSIPFVLLVIGAVGYRVIEGEKWTWADAIYMSAITLTTVGYGDLYPLGLAANIVAAVEAIRMAQQVALLLGHVAPSQRAVDLDEETLRLALGEAVADEVEEHVRRGLQLAERQKAPRGVEHGLGRARVARARQKRGP